jgi:hypothetical protein
MNAYTTQLKESIREKLDTIEDAEYLSSLDAILTYETFGKSNAANETVDPQPKWKYPLLQKLGFI